ncbi:hypothetical protein HDV00_008223 [Rhizophlyctis rosea]|nr:hypothetical protein HDV00_008223 [Rhizophlyctis rosea]
MNGLGISESREAVLSALLSLGADPNAPSLPGCGFPSILCCAVALGRVKLVKLLVDAGARADTDSASLLWAVYKGHQAIVGFLVGKGANMQARNGDGETTLHVAAGRLNGPMVELLLRLGGDPKATNRQKRNPAQVARECLKWKYGDGVEDEDEDEEVAVRYRLLDEIKDVAIARVLERVAEGLV